MDILIGALIEQVLVTDLLMGLHGCRAVLFARQWVDFTK
jgi:hypothetical protein